MFLINIMEMDKFNLLLMYIQMINNGQLEKLCIILDILLRKWGFNKINYFKNKNKETYQNKINNKKLVNKIQELINKEDYIQINYLVNIEIIYGIQYF